MKKFILSFLLVVLNIYPLYTKSQVISNKSLKEKISKMSLDEKAGQIFISFFYGNKLSPHAQELLKKTSLGNIIYFNWANGLYSKSQVKNLSEQTFNFILKETKLAPLIAIDQEGGIISRLQNDFSKFPGNMALGASSDQLLALKAARVMGRELQYSQINLNLAPVVDINTNPHNPIIGIRSFGDNPKKVAILASKMTDGFHENGILTCLKHFPGHGDVILDSHTSLNIVDKPLQEMIKVELFPFLKLKDQTDAIMTAHIIIPAIDPLPATLSKVWLTDYLREKWGYKGVIISDSITMRGVARDQTNFQEASKSISHAAIDAFLAGCDLIILGKLEWADFIPTQIEEERLIIEVIENFKKACRKKIIPQSRLDASLMRILKLKEKIKPISLDDFKENTKLPFTIAKKSLTLASSKDLFYKINTKLQNRDIAIIAPLEIKENLQNVLQEKDYNHIKRKFFQNHTLNTSLSKLQKELENTLQDVDLTIFLSYNAHLHTRQKDLINTLANKLGPNHFIIGALRNPQDILEQNFHKHILTLLTYSPHIASIKAMLYSLDKKELPQGKLPLQLGKIKDAPNKN